jgi:Big-like domain-containing protein/concanavalin A-like lectin/glucanase superfamily protein
MRWSSRSGLLAAAIAGSLIAATPAIASDYALQFNGASPGSDVVVHDPSQLFELGGGVSISATIRWDGTLGYQGVVSKPRSDYGAGDGTGYAMVLANGSPCMAEIGLYGSNRLWCGQLLTPGQWSHVTVSYDGQIETVTVDGNTTSQDFGSYDPAAEDIWMGTTTNLVIGHEFDNDQLGRGFHGALADVSVSAYPGGPVIASYGFDESSGNTLSNSSGNALSGLLSSDNTPQWVSGPIRDTTTTSGSTPDPSYVGQTVTLTATVTATGSGAVPTGTVTFMDGSTNLGSAGVDSSGVATLQTSALPAGSDGLTAHYGGDEWSASSDSAATTQTVYTPASGAQALGTTISTWNVPANGDGLSNQANAAASAFASGNTQAGCATLAGLINHAGAQSGKKLTAAQANQIIAEAQAAETAAGC